MQGSRTTAGSASVLNMGCKPRSRQQQALVGNRGARENWGTRNKGKKHRRGSEINQGLRRQHRGSETKQSRARLSESVTSRKAVLNSSRSACHC
jgi:hypothetical protein